MIGAEPRPPPASKPEPPNPDLPEKGAIHEAVKGGDVAGVKKCVASGSSVDQKDKLSRTSLHIAAWQGSAPMVEALLSLGYVALGAASAGAGARGCCVCVCVCVFVVMCVCVP
jgi:ankyrin repeat protein